MGENAAFSHDRRRSYDRELSELKGSLNTHCETTQQNFESLHKKTNANGTAICEIQNRLCHIETAVAPIKDIAGFFRIVKWIGGFIGAVGLIGGVVVGFLSLIGVNIGF